MLKKLKTKRGNKIESYKKCLKPEKRENKQKPQI